MSINRGMGKLCIQYGPKMEYYTAMKMNELWKNIVLKENCKFRRSLSERYHCLRAQNQAKLGNGFLDMTPKL